MRINKIILLVSTVLFLAGCATVSRKELDEEIQDLRRQMSSLSTQAQQKDEQIASLERSLGDKSKEESLQAQLKEKERLAASLQEALDKEAKERAQLAERLDALTGKSKPTPNSSIKQIQIALQNAGYDPGAIDGLMGSRSRKAIRDFQKDNGLDITGKIDKATWEKLRIYLHRKVK
ncbi:MAG: peptidoglycan-binding protein [Candidatus Omnitrophota bacterium]|nr:peptidoglycan-binding protein [Candidatus Omnitrophota bacterium]